MATVNNYLQQLETAVTVDAAEEVIFPAAYDKDITTEEYKGLISALSTRKQWIRSHLKQYDDETEAILSSVQGIEGEDDYNTELRLE